MGAGVLWPQQQGLQAAPRAWGVSLPARDREGVPSTARLRAPQLSHVFLKHIPFNCVQGGQDHLAAGQGPNHMQNYVLVLNPG